LGQKLRQRREARSLSLEQAVQATYIRLRYLRALEAGDFDVFTSETQRRGFLRTYASFLGLDTRSLLNELETEAAQPEELPAPAPPPPREAPAAEPVLEIYHEIGQKLREQRELLGLSPEDVERHTRLRKHYLQVLESGEYEELPSPVQGRGMLKIYSEFLALDSDQLLLRYAEALQAELQAKKAAERTKRSRVKRPSQQATALRKFISGELIISGAILLLVAGFVVWGILRVLETRAEQQPIPTAPSIADVLLATSTPSETPTPATPTATAPPALPLATEQVTQAVLTPQETLFPGQPGLIQLYLTVRQRAWMRVLVDEKTEFEGRVLPGSAYQFTGERQIEILTGNAAALQIFFNQQDLGPMGNFGQVVDRIYTNEGVLVPTETITPTPSETLPPSPTAPGSPATPANTPIS
jgi:cytoskeletal protein RodZ